MGDATGAYIASHCVIVQSTDDVVLMTSPRDVVDSTGKIALTKLDLSKGGASRAPDCVPRLSVRRGRGSPDKGTGRLGHCLTDSTRSR